MAHEISVNMLGQTESVFGYGEKPWWDSKNLQATVLPNAVSFDEIFSIAFPWIAEMEQLQYADGSLSQQHGIRRSDTKMELGVHSGTYGNIQPKDLFDFCASFFEAYPEVPISSAISMQSGAVLNISARLGEIDVLDSGDITRSYLCFVNSFNGRIKAQVYKSYVRPVCMNTTVSGISSADFAMSYKHTSGVRDRIKRDSNQAAQLMIAQQATDARIKEVLETLAKRKLKKETYVNILNALFPEESKQAESTKSDITALFADNDHNAFPDWKGTAYALFQAITRHADHERTVRITKGKSHLSEEQVRFENNFFDGIKSIGKTDPAKMDIKARALERILVLSDGTEVLESSPIVSLPPKNITPKYQKASMPIVTPSKTSQNSPQAMQDATSTELADYDDSAFLVAPESASTVSQTRVDLYTLAPQKYDLADTQHVENVEQVNDTLFMRHVTVSDDLVFLQIDVYTEAGFFVAGKDKWLEIQVAKKENN